MPFLRLFKKKEKRGNKYNEEIIEEETQCGGFVNEEREVLMEQECKKDEEATFYYEALNNMETPRKYSSVSKYIFSKPKLSNIMDQAQPVSKKASSIHTFGTLFISQVQHSKKVDTITNFSITHVDLLFYTFFTQWHSKEVNRCKTNSNRSLPSTQLISCSTSGEFIDYPVLSLGDNIPTTFTATNINMGTCVRSWWDEQPAKTAPLSKITGSEVICSSEVTGLKPLQESMSAKRDSLLLISSKKGFTVTLTIARVNVVCHAVLIKPNHKLQAIGNDLNKIITHRPQDNLKRCLSHVDLNMLVRCCAKT